MQRPKLKDNRGKGPFELYPIGQIPDEIIYEAAKGINHQIADGYRLKKIAYTKKQFLNVPRVRKAIRIAKALNKDVGDMEELFGGGNPGST